MKIEFKNGSGSIDPWTLEKIISQGKNIIVTDDYVIWVRVEDKYSFRVLPNTKSRVDSGEDPKEVLMKSLEFWRPGMKKKIHKFGHTIEIGIGEIDPKTKWGYMASGESYLIACLPGRVWVYYDDCPPFEIRDLQKFLEDLEVLPENEKELEELITLWTWK